jgi:hypothetical protein
LNAIAAILLMVAVVGVAAYFVVNAPKPVSTGVCACLGEGCAEKALELAIPSELAEQARSLGATVEEANGKTVIAAGGREYSKGGVTVVFAEPSKGFAVYEQLLGLGSWEYAGFEQGFSVYRSGTTTVAVDTGRMVVAENGNASDYVKCAQRP